MDRDKLIIEYQKLLERVDKANTWIENSMYKDWEEVKEEKYKVYHGWENIIKELEWIKEEMIKGDIIKEKVEGFEIIKAAN